MITATFLLRLAAAMALGLIPASIAKRKGRSTSFVSWWLYGTALFIVALPHALLLKSLTRKCAHCEELIKGEADICPYCGVARSATNRNRPDGPAMTIEDAGRWVRAHFGSSARVRFGDGGRNLIEHLQNTGDNYEVIGEGSTWREALDQAEAWANRPPEETPQHD